MNKKAIAILGAIFILIVGTLGYLIYTQYSTDTSGEDIVINDPNNPNNPGNNITPEPAPQPTPPPSPVGPTIVKLTDDQVVSPVLFFNGDGITYFDKQGSLYQADLVSSGNVWELSNKRQLELELKQNISKIIWPAKSDNFMAEINTGTKKTWSFYDGIARAYSDLPSQVYSFSFMPEGDKIYFVWSNSGGHDTVNIGDGSTQNYTEIGEIWDKNSVVNVSPDGLNILYYQDQISEVNNPINLTSPDGKVWRTLVKDGNNYGVLWSPDSKKFIFGKKDRTSQKYQLWVYNLLSEDVRNLGFVTIPEKAVWSQDSKTVYLAAPEQGTAEDGALTVDSFFKIDTDSLEKEEFNPAGQSIDARDLFLSQEEDRLFFRNAQDGGLYYLDIIPTN